MTAPKISENLLRRIPGAYKYFGFFCILFIALMVFVEINNGKFWTNDFRVYYDATNDYFNGNNPYEKPYGLSSGYFKYPPSTLYFFWISSNLNYFVAQLIHVLFLGIALIGSICLLHNKFLFNSNGITSKRNYAILYLAFSLIVMHVVREFHMGNVNLLLLFFFVLGITNLQTKNPFYTALFWSFIVILKPIVILAFIPLLFYKQWKLILYLTVFGLIYFLLPAIQKGWDGNIELWNSWFLAVSKHGEYIVSENSLTYLTNYYFGIRSTWIPSLILLVLLVITMLVHYLKYPKKENDLIQWSIVFLAFTPNFFVTDTEHFLLTLPLLILLIRILRDLQNKWLWIILVVLIIPFSFNMNDLLGHSISDKLDESGMLGISNIGFILMYVLLIFKRSKETNTI